MRTRSMQSIVFAAAACVLLLCGATALADPPTRPKEGFGVFLIVFGDGAAPSQLEVAKLGGVEHERRQDVWIVTLPLKARARSESVSSSGPTVLHLLSVLKPSAALSLASGHSKT